MCSTKVFRENDFFTTKLLNRWRNHLGQCHPIAYFFLSPFSFPFLFLLFPFSFPFSFPLSFTNGTQWYSRLKVHGSAQRWLRHLFNSEQILSQIFIPETANVPEDGATLHVQNAQNCAIYPVLNLISFFRERIFGNQNFDEKGLGRLKSSVEGKNNHV